MKTRHPSKKHLKKTRSGLEWPRDSDHHSHTLQKSRGDIFNIRASHSPIKTGMLIDKSKIEFKAESAKDKLTEKLIKHLSNTNASTLSNLSPGKTTASTPNGTRMKKRIDFSSVAFFSEQRETLAQQPPSQPIVKKEDAELDAFIQSDVFKLIADVKSNTKQVSHTISQSELEKITAKYKENNYRRETSQSAVVVKDKYKGKQVRAADYAEQVFEPTVLCDIKNIKWEWLHLVAYCLLGEKSQTVDNLICGLKSGNTAMMLVENEMQFLAEHYPDGFELVVTASLIPGTHAANKIEYKITTPDFTLPFNFDTLNPANPHVHFREYMRAFLRALVETCKESRPNMNPS